MARISSARYAAQVALRCSARLAPRAAGPLGFALPLEANTVTEQGSRAALWLGPDEWLVVDEAVGAAPLVAGLRAAFAGVHAAIVDVSSNREAILIEGADAEDLLAQAATLDFHASAFPPGACAQTNLARTQGIVWRRGPGCFVLLVRPSLSAYLLRWLASCSTAP